jgi:mycothiol synthase
VAQVSAGIYLPDDTSAAFLAHHGFEPERIFWLMERPLGARLDPAWPAGLETRVMDGSERSLADWNDCYNESFAAHYHFVPPSLEDARALTEQSTFSPGSVVLAYRQERCVGFVRSLLLPERGEVGVLGVVPGARGIGLGRALLRESVRWLEDKRAPRVTLMVDGENENALGLYRQEGFDVARTRQIWARALTP